MKPEDGAFQADFALLDRAGLFRPTLSLTQRLRLFRQQCRTEVRSAQVSIEPQYRTSWWRSERLGGVSIKLNRAILHIIFLKSFHKTIHNHHNLLIYIIIFCNIFSTIIS